MNDTHYLYAVLPCRKKQIDLLLSLLMTDVPMPNSLFLYGHSGTGKMTVLLLSLQHLNITTCIINCVESYNLRLMLESVLAQLLCSGFSGDHNCCASCDNFSDFVHNIRNIYRQQRKRIAVVLEHSERLRNMDANILPTFCRLQELCQDVELTTILVSRVPFDKFYTNSGLLEPITIFFPQYTKGETETILMLDLPEDVSEDFYRNYIRLFLSVSCNATKNLKELKYLAAVNFPAYLAPVKSGTLKENDARGLWQNIEPHLKKALSTVYLRQISSDQFQEMQKSVNDNFVPSLLFHNALSTELPYYSRFLLIAAYLASYNPPSTDRRYFVKNHGKTRKTQAMMKAKQKWCSQIVGPKAFPLDRLLAIFYSIVEEKVPPSSNIYIQVSDMVTLRFLSREDSGDQIDTPKFKCLVGLDFIRMIGKSVGFDIVPYLYNL